MLGDTVPHISEIHIRISVNVFEQTEAHREPFRYQGKGLETNVDGHGYHLGSASGAGYNCLIDTSRQTLPGIICSVSSVRAKLEKRQRGLPTQIQPGASLPLRFWNDFVDLLGHHNAVMHPVRESWAHRFRVACVDVDRPLRRFAPWRQLG